MEEGRMSYNAGHEARIKDIKRLAVQLKSITDELETRIGWLEELASSLLGITNSVITNITRED
ncbi:MAG: hypothetical protein IJG37_04795 [Synergistaceae bacterium]|nr:hypothetical protein [Synergistaceae bacterium]MBQ6665878.1 hypothetical protein [Synergistaceae bacterium]